MAKLLNELRKRIKTEVQQAAREKADNIIAEMTLAELRKARGQNQTAVAKRRTTKTCRDGAQLRGELP